MKRLPLFAPFASLCVRPPPCHPPPAAPSHFLLLSPRVALRRGWQCSRLSCRAIARPTLLFSLPVSPPASPSRCAFFSPLANLDHPPFPAAPSALPPSLRSCVVTAY